VRADEAEVGAADGGHANEVVGAGPERGEGGGERDPAACLHADRGGDHLLLGDVHLEVALGEGVAEDLGMGGVADLAVHRDDARLGGADGAQRLAVGASRGDHVAKRPGRQADGSPFTRR
jgi:hypothetical protein